MAGKAHVTMMAPWDVPEGASADLVVVIDVLRATTTAACLCKGGSELLVLPDALSLASVENPGQYVVFSELDIPAPWERLDNSPSIAVGYRGEKTPILITTNGTKAIHRGLRIAPQVVLASFVNLQHAAEFIAQHDARNIMVLPAGYQPKREDRYEDSACAELLTNLLNDRKIDANHVREVASTCWKDPRIMRRLDLKSALQEDFELALSPNTVGAVPVATLNHGRIEVRSLPLGESTTHLST